MVMRGMILIMRFLCHCMSQEAENLGKTANFVSLAVKAQKL